MAPETKELNKVAQYVKDLTAQIKSSELEDVSEITVENMMNSINDDGDGDNIGEEIYLPHKSRKHRGKIFKEAIKTIPKLRAMAAKRCGSQSKALEKLKGDRDDEKEYKLLLRYYLPCSPMACNVCGKVKDSLEESLDHKSLNHCTHTFACPLANCGCIYEAEKERNRHVKKH